MSIETGLRRICLALFIGLSCTAHCAGQIPEADARKGPNVRAPALREGLVFTSTWFAMAHAGHARDFKQDDHGDWIAPDGTHLQGMNRPSTSAGGISQTRITCIAGDHLFLVSHSYTDMRLLGFPDPMPQGKPVTFVVKVDGCDLWMEPGKLAQLQSDAATHRVVQPVQWKLGQQMIPAIRVTTASGDGYIDHIFDRTTGICLHAAASSTEADPKLKFIAPGDTPHGDTQLTEFNLIALRDVNTPWASEPLPAWTKQFKMLHYDGESQIPNGNPYFPPTRTQLGLDVGRLDSGDGWLSTSTAGYVLLQGQQRLPSKGIYLSGHDQFDAFCAGPEGLAKLQPGQVLDDDPITHVQIAVKSVEGNNVTIVAGNRSGQVARTYDRESGKLLAFSTSDRMTRIQTSFQLHEE